MSRTIPSAILSLALAGAVPQAMAQEGEDETGSEAAAEQAQDLATDDVDSESEAQMTDVEGRIEVLTMEGFDYDEAVAEIETAAIDDSQKATLLSGLDAARDDPEALAEILERAQEIMANQ